MAINVTIIDYGLGNIWSVKNAFEFLGSQVEVTSDPKAISNADCLILPGVGSFDKGIKNLYSEGIIDSLNEAVLVKKKPILGICLGMQLLADRSEEGQSIDGLGYISGSVLKITRKELRIPHIGFNETKASNNKSFFSSVVNSNFYFVHSYHFIPTDSNHIICTTNYGTSFVSGIQKDNVIGVQFHPEKSQSSGLVFLKNFINFSKERF